MSEYASDLRKLVWVTWSDMATPNSQKLCPHGEYLSDVTPCHPHHLSTAVIHSHKEIRMMQEPLTVRAIRAEPNPSYPGTGNRLIFIECPYCGRQHMHGWPEQDGDDDPGHRVAHCVEGSNPGYVILAPETH